ncbi:MAG: carbohydrate ABC transporter permease [Clostridiales bacterium]|jgi:multiple sugar transport system permease protein|nr:carbohydrate ABC transporter permease [Clostridiales bacterium]
MKIENAAGGPARKRNTPLKRRVKRAAAHTVLALASAVLIFPVFTVFMTALKGFDQIVANPGALFPRPPHWRNFIDVFTVLPFFTYLKNSVVVVVCSVGGVALSSSLVAYGFSRFQNRYKEIVFSVMLATIMIPGQVLMIPTFEMFQSFGWVDTLLPFIVPPLFGGGVTNVFLIRQFMRGLPKSLFESAEIEGASEFRIYAQITLPLSKAVLFTVAIFTFLGAWSDFMGPLIYLSSPSRFTLAYGMYVYFSTAFIGATQPWHLICAVNLVIIVPVVALYFFAQRYFVQGIQLTGIKN